MIKEDLTETDLIKERFKDIICVNKLLCGIIEYTIEENWTSDKVSVYRFRNNKNISISEKNKDEVIGDEKFSKIQMILLNIISTMCLIGIYCIIATNIKVLIKIPMEYTVSLLLIYTYPISKLIISRIKGFNNINDVKESAIAGAISIIPLAIGLILIELANRNYIMLMISLVISLIACLRYMIMLMKVTDMSELE